MRGDRTETCESEDTLRRRGLTGLVIFGCLLWAAPAAADPITGLNVIAADTIFSGGRPPGAAPLLDFAMVHAAITTRNAATTMMRTTGITIMVVAATGASKSEPEPVVPAGDGRLQFPKDLGAARL